MRSVALSAIRTPGPAVPSSLFAPTRFNATRAFASRVSAPCVPETTSRPLSVSATSDWFCTAIEFVEAPVTVTFEQTPEMNSRRASSV